MKGISYISKKHKIIDSEGFFMLLDDFIRDSYTGKRLSKSGSRVSYGTIQNYEYMRQTLIAVAETGFEMKLFVVPNLTHRGIMKAGNYYRDFYKVVTNYLYNDLNVFDNYVGTFIKNIKVFFNYVKNQRLIDIGDFHKSFYCPQEEIDIITLNTNQLRTIIFDTKFANKVENEGFEHIKDIFAFGCTVALRASDLLNLTEKNIVRKRSGCYVQVKSKKTKTKTIIKLPQYAVKIIDKYKGQYATILPKVSLSCLDKKIKRICELLPDNYVLPKTRERKGRPVIIYKNPEKKIHYRFSDHISAHTMRRTAITNMLNAGMPEHLVRKISGHAPNSKEFYRYVKLSQNYLDKETDAYFKKLENTKKNKEK